MGSGRYLANIQPNELHRLNIQHRVLTKAFGGILYAPVTLKDGDAVLDSGTGTGMSLLFDCLGVSIPEWPLGCWTIDCYEASKAAIQCYGIDITTNIFPVVDESIAPNLHFSQGNIVAPQGKWAENSYKLINQRLLIAALSAEDWKTVVGNIYNLLAPGGWVQLVEANHCYSGEATEKHRAVLKRAFEKRGVLLDPIYNIPALLGEAGFVAINTKDYEISLGKWAGKDGEEARDSCIGVYRGMKHPVVDLMGLLPAREFDLLIDQMEEEWDSIEGSKVRYNIFYAQKPETA